MNFKNKINQKIISFLVIIAIITPIFIFSTPKKTEAVFPATIVNDTAPVSWLTKFFTGATSVSSATTASINIKEWAKEVLRETLRTFARRLLQQMTQATINWINSGFHGAPLFLERPGAFFKDIGKYEIKKLVNIIGYDSNKYPFGKSTAINTIESYKKQFATNAQYSLSQVTRDPQLLSRYRNNFSVGGWNGFLLNTQYPQNNSLGFQMMYEDELAKRLRGTGQNQADIVKDTLQQGMGFLSPQTCPSNPRYNNLKNQFNQPTFKSSTPEPTEPEVPTRRPDESNDEWNTRYNSIYDTYDEQKLQWSIKNDNERINWESENGCPGGLVNTTPGSVVSAQIMKAITGPYDQTSLAAAMGNSLSAIFDALLNKFMKDGLNALSSKISGNGNNTDDDNFSYYGHTLGSPSVNTTSGTGFNWGGPDEEIILTTFKKDVNDAITRANTELKLIDNTDVNNLGLSQLFDRVLQKTQELDMCLPGPNVGWEDRLDNDIQSKFTTDTAYNDSITATANSFKEWVKNKMRSELPSSPSYLSEVSSTKTTSEKVNELVARKDTLTQTLVKLESIRGSLSAITTQPAPGSENEKTMVRLKERINGMILELSTNETVREAQNVVDDLKDKVNYQNTLIIKCSNERTAKTWTNPGGENSLFNNIQTEKTVFCTSYGNNNINCNAIYNSSSGDYKISDTPSPYSTTVNPTTTPTETRGICQIGVLKIPGLTKDECLGIEKNNKWTPS
ncbi:MAG: hypothetical protein AAB510_03285 [Patescibacteria group bacterium]